MNVYGALKEFTSLVYRIVSGNKITVSHNASTASAGDVTIETPPKTTGTSVLVDTDTAQILSSKTVAAPVVTGTAVFDNGAVARFEDADGSHYTEVKANDTTTASVTYSLPAAGPAADGQVLASTQLGVTSWTSPFTNPMDDAGQIIYGAATGTPTKLAAGTAKYVLQSNGTSAPGWVNVLEMGNGSASAPTYSFSSSSNTGMYLVNSRVLAFSFAGSRRASIVSSASASGVSADLSQIIANSGVTLSNGESTTWDLDNNAAGILVVSASNNVGVAYLVVFGSDTLVSLGGTLTGATVAWTASTGNLVLTNVSAGASVSYVIGFFRIF